MITSSSSSLQKRLALLAAHLVVAVIALIVIGGATRVMEAGLACPDWPLCYGSFLPGSQMNLQVFLEWFHRLDAFLVGIALLAQMFLTLAWRSKISPWIPWVSFSLVMLVLFQGALGALTVLQLLPSLVVTAHLALALTLLAGVSALSQWLWSSSNLLAPIWWRLLAGTSLLAVIVQCLLGGLMATQWSFELCLTEGKLCEWLNLHSNFAMFASFCLLLFVITSLLAGGWPRSQWRWLLSVLGLLVIQITLGMFSVRFGLSRPLLIVSHQLVAALLVALMSALTFRRPEACPYLLPFNCEKLSVESLNG